MKRRSSVVETGEAEVKVEVKAEVKAEVEVEVEDEDVLNLNLRRLAGYITNF